MPLEPNQSAPGNRFSGPDGQDYDIIARVSTDAGPFVITRRSDGGPLSPGALLSEGDLRDHEDVAFVSTIAAAKAAEADKREQAEAEAAEADRQERIRATNERAEADAAAAVAAEREQAEAEAAANNTDTTDTTDTAQETSETSPPPAV